LRKGLAKKIDTMMLLAPVDVLNRGLRYLGVCRKNSASHKANLREFCKHYGARPLDLADMWYDLTTTTIPEAALEPKDKTEYGFMFFMIAHYFLWVYPKNANLLASRFRVCETYAQGQTLWRWIGKIAAMKAKKIIWPTNHQWSEKFIVSVDGTDFKIWEPKHPTLPIDKGYCSHKFNHAAVKYEIVLSVNQSKCVLINGPFRGGMHDLDMVRAAGGLKEKMNGAIGKKAIADRGYKSSKPDEQFLSTPDRMDPAELYNFKSRVRLRHETFNGRLKKYGSLQQTFRHGKHKHKKVLEAICVIVQYQMDNGSELFAV
jgi:hypothetical protein